SVAVAAVACALAGSLCPAEPRGIAQGAVCAGAVWGAAAARERGLAAYPVGTGGRQCGAGGLRSPSARPPACTALVGPWQGEAWCCGVGRSPARQARCVSGRVRGQLRTGWSHARARGCRGAGSRRRDVLLAGGDVLPGRWAGVPGGWRVGGGVATACVCDGVGGLCPEFLDVIRGGGSDIAVDGLECFGRTGGGEAIDVHPAAPVVPDN